jgi:SAM-dependent methyltransferase
VQYRHLYLARSRKQFIGPLLQYFRGCKLILDVGCGSGWISRSFQEFLSATVVSVDVRSQSLQCGVHNPVRMDARFLGFTEAFDMVIAKDVLEHLYDPAKALTQFAQLLKPDGRVLINVPTPDAPYFWDDYTHIRPYTKNSLNHLLDETGFNPVYSHYLARPTLGAALLRLKGLADALAEHGFRRGDLVTIAQKKPTNQNNKNKQAQPILYEAKNYAM